MPQNMDVEQILATLASLQQPGAYAEQHPPSDHFGQAYPASTHRPQQHVYPQPILQHAARDPLPSPWQPVPQKPQERAHAPIVDPSTITEWKQGLRCVSKIANQNPDFAAAVRKLMQEQEGNVKQWEAGRKRLLEEQKVKKETEKTNRAALSLPGLLENTPLLRTSECEQEELEQYHAKVYRACRAMVDSQTSSLKVLGVPFFGVKPGLIVHDDEQPAYVESTTGSDKSSDARKITNSQLLELQRKMLNHLTELYGD